MNDSVNTDGTLNCNLKGDAAFWWNLKRSGDGDVSTRHAGCPVLVGSKWGEWKRIFFVHATKTTPWKQSNHKESKFSFMPPASLFLDTDVAAYFDVKWERLSLSRAGFSKHCSLFFWNDRNASVLPNLKLLDFSLILYHCLDSSQVGLRSC